MYKRLIIIYIQPLPRSKSKSNPHECTFETAFTNHSPDLQELAPRFLGLFHLLGALCGGFGLVAGIFDLYGCVNGQLEDFSDTLLFLG